MTEEFHIDKLYAALDQLSPEVIADHHAWPCALALTIIHHFLGAEWIAEHIRPDAASAGSILRWRASDPGELAIQTYRIVDLGESLLNLRHLAGFSDCVTRMLSSPNPEFGLAELHIGKMLFINGWDFCFIVPQGIAGKDYDFGIDYYGHALAGETKCRVEALDEPSSKVITNILHDHRKQLPPDGPGIFFIKIPQSWMKSSDWERTSVMGALDFFAEGTGRVVSVVFYLEPLYWRDGIMAQGHRFKEVLNPRRRHGKDVDWKLFERWRPLPGAMNTMPPKWTRLIDFPKGIFSWKIETE